MSTTIYQGHYHRSHIVLQTLSQLSHVRCPVNTCCNAGLSSAKSEIISEINILTRELVPLNTKPLVNQYLHSVGLSVLLNPLSCFGFTADYNRWIGKIYWIMKFNLFLYYYLLRDTCFLQRTGFISRLVCS